MDGLIGAQGNVGFSSIVSAAIRLHDQRIHIGQGATALAAISLQHQQQPRDLAVDLTRLEEVRHALCGGTEGVPNLLWPYRDLAANHPAFIAIKRLAARGLLPMSQGEVDFQPDAPATDEWRESVLKLFTGYDLNLVQRTDEILTRGEFARQLWQRIGKQALPANKTP